jgi:hypothetical protein
MHGVFKLGDVCVLGDVVDRRGRETHAPFTICLAAQIYEAVADVQRSGAVVGIVVVELI